MTTAQRHILIWQGALWFVLFGFVLLAFTGCVVIGDYAPQLNASIGTGGASSGPNRDESRPNRVMPHPLIADDLQE